MFLNIEIETTLSFRYISVNGHSIPDPLSIDLKGVARGPSNLYIFQYLLHLAGCLKGLVISRKMVWFIVRNQKGVILAQEDILNAAPYVLVLGSQAPKPIL